MMVSFVTSQGTLARPRLLLEVVLGAGLMACFYAVLLKQPGTYRGLVAFLYLALLLLMAVHDIRSLRVPNVIAYPALGLGVAASLTLGWSDAIEALLGGAAAFLLLLFIAIAGKGAMGFADVKVGALCGIVVGLGGVLQMLFVAFAGGAVLSAALLVLRLRKPKDVMAFTPFLVVATAFSISYFHLYLVP
jgi:prepilin signal peptidase PulO-like enzyme (type II secretory pathway)